MSLWVSNINLWLELFWYYYFWSTHTTSPKVHRLCSHALPAALVKCLNNLKDEEEDCNTDGTVMGTEKLHLCSWKLELGQTDENWLLGKWDYNAFWSFVFLRVEFSCISLLSHFLSYFCFLMILFLGAWACLLCHPEPHGLPRAFSRPPVPFLQ